jgi:mRNA interferase HigB
MRISGSKKVKQFIVRHPSCRGVMNAWLKTVREVFWRNPADIINTYNQTDCVSTVWIFNVGGNKYRLAARIFFSTQRVHILKVQTHAEYDKEDWTSSPPTH